MKSKSKTRKTKTKSRIRSKKRNQTRKKMYGGNVEYLENQIFHQYGIVNNNTHENKKQAIIEGIAKIEISQPKNFIEVNDDIDELKSRYNITDKEIKKAKKILYTKDKFFENNAKSLVKASINV